MITKKKKEMKERKNEEKKQQQKTKRNWRHNIAQTSLLTHSQNQIKPS